LRGEQKISLNAALSGSAGLAIVAHCKHSKRKKHHVADGSLNETAGAVERCAQGGGWS